MIDSNQIKVDKITAAINLDRLNFVLDKAFIRSSKRMSCAGILNWQLKSNRHTSSFLNTHC